MPVVSLFFPYPLIASLVVKQSGHCFAVSLFGVSDGATEPVSSSSSCISPEALLSIDTGSQRNIVKHVFKRVISIWGPGYLDGPVSAERRSRVIFAPVSNRQGKLVAIGETEVVASTFLLTRPIFV